MIFRCIFEHNCDSLISCIMYGQNLDGQCIFEHLYIVVNYIRWMIDELQHLVTIDNHLFNIVNHIFQVRQSSKLVLSNMCVEISFLYDLCGHDFPLLLLVLKLHFSLLPKLNCFDWIGCVCCFHFLVSKSKSYLQRFLMTF